MYQLKKPPARKREEYMWGFGSGQGPVLGPTKYPLKRVHYLGCEQAVGGSRLTVEIPSRKGDRLSIFVNLG
jgi:hypothetical protein